MCYLNPYVHTCIDQPNLTCPACSWAEEQQVPDVLVREGGTIWLFHPLSGRACQWVQEQVLSEPWQWLGGQLGVERRLASALIEAMRKNGLAVHVE